MTTDQKVRNRNNRKRGSSFEKRCADILDMDVVPYSGSNARFGFGDIRDSIWLGECKNITPKDGNITIQIDWLTKNLERANNINHLSFLAWMPAGRTDKFIILDRDTFMRFGTRITAYLICTKKSHNTRNIILPYEEVKHFNRDRIISMTIAGSGEYWYMMSIELFKELINEHGIKGERITI